MEQKNCCFMKFVTKYYFDMRSFVSIRNKLILFYIQDLPISSIIIVTFTNYMERQAKNAILQHT